MPRLTTTKYNGGSKNEREKANKEKGREGTRETERERGGGGEIPKDEHPEKTTAAKKYTRAANNKHPPKKKKQSGGREIFTSKTNISARPANAYPHPPRHTHTHKKAQQRWLIVYGGVRLGVRSEKTREIKSMRRASDLSKREEQVESPERRTQPHQRKKTQIESKRRYARAKKNTIRHGQPNEETPEEGSMVNQDKNERVSSCVEEQKIAEVRSHSAMGRGER